MNVNFEYYRIFYYVAKYRNFTKAARVLGNSQPNITRAMNCLEQQVHATLFIRTNRGVQLTSEGEELYNYVSAAMAQIFAAEEALSENDGLLYGNIVIGTSETALNIFWWIN
ncbi:MAG: LysR family transcriptional regulator [Coprococcus sp.]